LNLDLAKCWAFKVCCYFAWPTNRRQRAYQLW